MELGWPLPGMGPGRYPQPTHADWNVPGHDSLPKTAGLTVNSKEV